MTDDDILRFLRRYLAAQSVETLRHSFGHWRTRLASFGVTDMEDPRASDFLSLFVLQAASIGNPRIEHNLRDILGIRPYKG